MNDHESLLDEVGDNIGDMFIFMAMVGVLWLLWRAYLIFAAIFGAILTEIIWPMVRWLLIQTGILLLRGYNRASRIVLGLDQEKG